MAGRDVIVVGASAGGVEALSRLVGALPEDLPAAVFIVLHMAPHSGTALPHILERRTKLPVAQARDGEPIKPQRAYVAVPDRHLLLAPGRVRVVNGPKENGHRPAVDTLFRSAAAAYGRRVVGIVLSGTRDDGTAGLRAIHQRGGLSVVQDPDDAVFPGMPQSALAGDHPDHVLPLSAIGELLTTLARNGHESEGRVDTTADGLDAEQLWSNGHGSSAESLLAVQHADVDAAMWTAYRALEERAALLWRLVERAEVREAEITSRHFRAEAADVDRQAELLRTVLSTKGSDEGESGAADA